MKLTTITPELAGVWLQKVNAERQRHLSKAHVAFLQRAIERGEWECNAETIKLTGDGWVIDGQHRLQAVVRSGKTIKSYVAHGVPDTMFDTIDTGRPRSGADTLAARGLKFGYIMTGAVRLLLGEQAGKPPASWITHKVSNRELLGFVADNPLIVESAQRGAGSRIIAGTVMAYFHFRLSAVDSEAAEQFIADLKTDADLPETDAAYRVREKVNEMKLKGFTLPPADVIRMCITAWNKRRTGTPTQRQMIKRKVNGEVGAMPAIHG